MLTRLQKLVPAAVILLTIPAISPTTAAHGATVPVVTVLPPVAENVGSPLRLVFDSKGNFYVTDPRKGGVSKFNSTGQLIGVLKTPNLPQGIAFNDRGNLLVSQGDAVVILDMAGTEIGRLGSGAGQFRKANGIAVDAAGYVYVVDTLDNSVKVFTAAGQYAQTIGSRGAGNGEFSLPTGIAYEKSTDQIVVADTENGRVQFFNASGNHEFIKSMGTIGIKPLQFKSPVGVAFDYDAAGGLNRMYVVDTYRNDVQVMDPSGEGAYLATIGGDGLANGQLTVPMDVAFDPANRRLAVVNGYGYLTMYGIDIRKK
ncbi:NHL repeat-containing protein [Geomobilimonas luticola]|uniref:NHL repeat-containing protein n=1 Tax=Geomobilimonas luticola TaxID=1114878 RepID=A0ABS5SCG7_9BACT|nr:NHL repeat-containing protein [Geomobilimonas luticola]MBT0652307.1 NHL repeat-containing protein [Geomobilimonas luticola]